jgi:hypothetical protein
MIKLGLQLEDDKIEEEVPGLSANAETKEAANTMEDVD